MSPKTTILIVEDDLDLRSCCRELLEEAGYAVEEAGDGEKALNRLNDHARPRPDLILLDLAMPRLDGRQMLAIMKIDEGLQGIPVVLSSASEPDLDPVRHGTIAGFLRKPYPASQLLDLLAKLVQRR